MIFYFSGTGNTMKILQQHLPLNSAYSVIMPSNYIVGSDIESKALVHSKTNVAKMDIQRISKEVKEKQSVINIKKGKWATLKSSLVWYAFNKFARSTKPFYSTDSCIGCGQCAKNCPTKTIEMISKKPKWNKKCYSIISTKATY